MFNNPAIFSNNTNMLSRSFEETVRLVKGRARKDRESQNIILDKMTGSVPLFQTSLKSTVECTTFLCRH